MLTVVDKNGPLDRLRVAAAHIEAAVAHINNAAQAQMPIRTGSGDHAVSDLRLIVRALGDIRDELRTRAGAAPSEA